MTIDWFFVLFICFIIVLFLGILIVYFRQYRTIKILMKQQALKRNGTVVGSFLLPVLKFSYHSLPFVVTSLPATKYRQAKTEVTITLPKPVAADLKITRESLSTRVQKALGVTDVQLGIEEFDNQYLIKTDNESFARNLLNLTLQQHLLEMKQEKPRINLGGTRLVIQVPRVIKTEEHYDHLFDLAYTFSDRIQDL
jgi:hypothetical protein